MADNKYINKKLIDHCLLNSFEVFYSIILAILSLLEVFSSEPLLPPTLLSSRMCTLSREARLSNSQSWIALRQRV